ASVKLMRITIRNGTRKAKVSHRNGTAMTNWRPLNIFLSMAVLASAGQDHDVGAVPPRVHALVALQRAVAVALGIGARDFQFHPAVQMHVVVGLVAEVGHGADLAGHAVVAHL